MINFDNDSSINWDQKGTGWIPDYPDIRDYYLKSEEIQNNSNIIRDEAGGSIEVLASNFSALLENLKAHKNLEDVSDNISTIEQIITRKILGEVVIANVQYQRILRKGMPDCPETMDLKFNLYRLANPDDIHLNRITIAGVPYQFSGLRTHFRQHWSDRNPHEHLKDPRFDLPTEEMVRAFQKDFNRAVVRANRAIGLLEDGVVGFRTHTAIQTCIKHLGQTFSDNQTFFKTVQEPQIEFISIPSVMPPDVFIKVIDTLNKFEPTPVKDKQSQTYQDKSAPDQGQVYGEQLTIKVFLERTINSFLQIIGKGFAESAQENIEKDSCCKNSRSDEILKKVFPEIISKIAQAPQEPHELSGLVANETELNIIYLHAFRTIYQTTFIEIEPLISVMTKLISPLANHEDLPSAFEQGIIKLIVIVDLFKDHYSDYFFDKASNIYNLILPQKVEESLTQYGLVLPDRNKVFSKEELADAWHAITKVYARLCRLRKQRAAALTQRIKALHQKLSNNPAGALKDGTVLRDYKFYIVQEFYNWLEYALRFKGLEKSDSEARENDNLPHLLKKSESSDFPNNLWNRAYICRLHPKEISPAIASSTFKLPVARSFSETYESTESSQVHKFFFLPAVVDLSFWCSPVVDQKTLNACSAYAAVGLMEYFVRKQLKKRVKSLSPMFLYKVTRNLMHQIGDTGASIRETMKAMTLFGVPPMDYWPYDLEKFDNEPTPFCYSFAQNFQALKYFRIDYANMPRELLLFQIQALISAGFPCIFGLTLYSSAYKEKNIQQGFIPCPDPKLDKRVGGHALMAVGYDDFKMVSTEGGMGSSSPGALLVRNSWGAAWGKGGYGWLPYDYIMNGLTSDWWSLLKAEWFDVERFGIGATWTSEGDPREKGVIG
ncbi:MAG: C1 family peptidase [Cyanobacteria bacterium P01_G01_bin.38]